MPKVEPTIVRSDTGNTPSWLAQQHKFVTPPRRGTYSLHGACGWAKALRQTSCFIITITIKPLVIEKEDPTFKAEWNSAIEAAEKSLMVTLQNHLTRVVDKTTRKIRKTAKQTIKKLKQIHDDSTAKSIIEETITEADNDRKKRNETREKRKMEAAKAPDNKKRKTTK